MDNQTTTESAPKPKKTKPKKAPAKNPTAPKPKKAPAKKPGKKTPAKAAKKPGKKAPAKKAPAKKTDHGFRGKGPINIKKGLYALLLRRLPEKYRIDKDTLDFDAIAKMQSMTKEGVYKWFRTDTIPPDRALIVIKASGGKLREVDFIPFVFKK